MIALLTGVGGAWATIYQVSLGSQVTDLATLSDANYYVLLNTGSSKYNYYDGTQSQMSEKSNVDYSSVVRIDYNSGTGIIKIKQECTGTYYQAISTEGTRLALGATAAEYTFVNDGCEANCFRFANSGRYLNNRSGGYPAGWNTGYDGGYSQWKIYEVTLTVTEEDPTDLSFYIRNTAGGYVSTSHTYTTSSYDAAKYKVAQGTGENAAYYTIYDCTAGKYVNFTGTANNTANVLTNADAIGENSYWDLIINPTGYDGYYAKGVRYITPKGGSNVSWNFFGGNKPGKVIGLWTSTENGSWQFVVEEPDFGDYAYTLVCSRTGLTVTGSDATSLTTTAVADLAYLASDSKQQFAFVTSSLGNKYLYNISTEKFVNKDGSLSEYPSDAIILESSGHWEYPWVFKFDDNHYINTTGTPVALTINTWGKGTYGKDLEFDDGNMFKTPDRVAYDLTTAESKLVANVTYQIVYGGSNSISAIVNGTEVGAALELPNVLKRGYIESYTFYSDAACTNEITKVPSGGNVTVYVKAVLSASCPITFSTEASPVWYVLQGRARTDDPTKHQSLYSDGTNVKASADPDATDAYKWAFIGNPFAFQLMNATQDGEGNNYYVVPGATNSANATVSTTGTTFGLFKNSKSSESGHIAIATYDGTNESVLNLANGTASTVDTYVGTGATFTDGSIGGLSNAYFMTKAFSYASFAEIYFANNSIGTKMALSFGNTVGYPKSTSTGYTELGEATLAAEWNETTYGTLQTKYAAFLAETAITMPTDGKVYTFTNVQKDNSTKYYIYENGSGSLEVTGTKPTDGSDEFICHSTGAGTYAFVAKSGYWLAGATNASGGKALSKTYDADKQPATISKYPSTSDSNLETTPELAFGKVSILIKRIADPGQATIRNTVLLVQKTGENGAWNGATGPYLTNSYSSMYTLTEVSDYYNKVTLTSDGSDAYASIYLPFAATIPAGVKAFAVESQDGSIAMMEEIVGDEAGTLPANTGAILKKYGQDANETIYLSPAEEAGSLSVTNLLSGTVETEARNTTGTTYVLGKYNGEIGLCQYTGTNLAKGKAYLFVSGTGSTDSKALSLYFGTLDDDDVTTVQSATENQKANVGQLYDLTGRKVKAPQKGQLYIQNGKTILY